MTDRKFQGLVYGIDARIHTILRPSHPACSGTIIVFRSPQFKYAKWSYAVRREADKIDVQEIANEE